MTLLADRFDPADSPVLVVSFPEGGLALITGTAVKDPGWKGVADDLEITINTRDPRIGIDPSRILGTNGTAYPTSFGLPDEGTVAVNSVTTETVAGVGVRLSARVFADDRSTLNRVGFQIMIRFR